MSDRYTYRSKRRGDRMWKHRMVPKKRNRAYRRRIAKYYAFMKAHDIAECKFSMEFLCQDYTLTAPKG